MHSYNMPEPFQSTYVNYSYNTWRFKFIVNPLIHFYRPENTNLKILKVLYCAVLTNILYMFGDNVAEANGPYKGLGRAHVT